MISGGVHLYLEANRMPTRDHRLRPRNCRSLGCPPLTLAGYPPIQGPLWLAGSLQLLAARTPPYPFCTRILTLLCPHVRTLLCPFCTRTLTLLCALVRTYCVTPQQESYIV